MIFPDIEEGFSSRELLTARSINRFRESSPTPDPRTRFQSASDFVDALRVWRVEFDQGPRRIPKHRAEEWARIARKTLAKRAQRIMDEQCPDDFPYVPSGLAVVLDRDQAVSPPKALQLSEEDRVKVLKGEPSSEWEKRDRDRPPRYWIQADSGMGKSILLVDAERLIASDAAGRIPVRFGAAPKLEHKQLPLLSAITEWHSKEKVLKFLSDVIINGDVLPDTKPNERSDWLHQMMTEGRVVFLLDALDQTKCDLEALGVLFSEVEPFSHCPVLLTGRPEPEHERNTVFNAQTWATFLVKEFDEPGQRTYLGVYADKVLGPPDKRSLEEKGEAFFRGHSFATPADKWRKLCGVPLLLRFIKDLAVKNKLPIEGTRESMYAAALHELIKNGMKVLRNTELQPPSPEQIELQLREIAWCMADSLDLVGPACAQGDDYGTLASKYASQLRALRAVDVTTVAWTGANSIAWRHRSFLEYYAGVALAKQETAEQERVTKKKARDPAWRWVLHFALEFAARKEPKKLLPLAKDLIRFGNPFVVYRALLQNRPGDVVLPGWLERLCRWLVHRDIEWDWKELHESIDYGTALVDNHEIPCFTVDSLEVLTDYFLPEHRESRCVHAAWELLEKWHEDEIPERHKHAIEDIMRQFLGEFPALVEKNFDANSLQDCFLRCPKYSRDDGVPYWRGVSQQDKDAYDNEFPRHQVKLSLFRLMQCPVTNRQYELFDPGHRYLRDRFSNDDDQPVIWVNWYMAKMFCRWLGPHFRLPTEAEWEYACRAGTETAFAFGESLGSEQANFDHNVGATTEVGAYKPNDWGFCDMHGNVWEWCDDGYDEEEYAKYQETLAENPRGPESASYRLTRGGSWNGTPRLCRSSFRGRLAPVSRNDFLGFRVASVQSSQEGAGAEPTAQAGREEAEPRPTQP